MNKITIFFFFKNNTSTPLIREGKSESVVFYNYKLIHLRNNKYICIYPVISAIMGYKSTSSTDYPNVLLKSTKEWSFYFFIINSHHSLFCNTNKFTHCRSHINYAVREKAAMVQRREGENEEFSFLCSLVEYSYKINFLCFRALFVSGRRSHFLFVKLLGTRKWVNPFW